MTPDSLPPLQFSHYTQRLLLRALTVSDYPVWKETHLNLPKTDNYWATGPSPSEELKRKIYRKKMTKVASDWMNDRFYSFAVFDRTTHQLVGSLSLMDISRLIFQNAYVGYEVYSPNWGNAFGREILEAGIKIAFCDLKLHRIEAGIAPNNRASIALAESVGMRFEGLSKKRLFYKGVWSDMRIYALTCEDLDLQKK